MLLFFWPTSFSAFTKKMCHQKTWKQYFICTQELLSASSFINDVCSGDLLCLETWETVSCSATWASSAPGGRMEKGRQLWYQQTTEVQLQVILTSSAKAKIPPRTPNPLFFHLRVTFCSSLPSDQRELTASSVPTYGLSWWVGLCSLIPCQLRGGSKGAYVERPATWWLQQRVTLLAECRRVNTGYSAPKERQQQTSWPLKAASSR